MLSRIIPRLTRLTRPCPHLYLLSPSLMLGRDLASRAGPPSPTPHDVDTLLHGRWVVPIVPHNKVMENSSIALDQSGPTLLPNHELIITKCNN